MKSTAQKAKSESPSRSRASATPMQTGARHGVGNRYRAGSLECQADELAVRALRGEKGLAAQVGRTAAAAYRLPSSPGLPLPPALRRDLEQSFGADFSEVRIHTDEPANDAATEESALAFTSGRHVFFRRRMFAPHTPAGKLLLAHELTHVLQQTGRSTSSGRLKATPAVSDGEIQRVWVSPLSGSSLPGTVQEVLARIKDQAPATERRQIEAIESALAAAQDANAFWVERERIVLAGETDPLLNIPHAEFEAHLLAALYDGLKVSGRTAGAARLLELFPSLKTLFYSAATYEAFADAIGPERLLERIYDDWYTAPFFGNATPRFMLDRVAILLFGSSSTSSESTIARGQLLVPAAEIELRRIDTANVLIENEVHFVTVKVAAQIESNRFTLLNMIRDEVMRMPRAAEAARADIKLQMARNLAGRFDRLIAGRADFLSALPANRNGLVQESALIWIDDLVPAIRDLAYFAVAHWEAAGQFSQQLDDPDLAVRREARRTLARLEREIPEFDDDVTRLADELLARESDRRLADPENFNRRRVTALRVFRGAVFDHVDRRFADRLIDALPSGRPGERRFAFSRERAETLMAPERRLLFGWASGVASYLYRVGEDYSVTHDQELIRLQRLVDASAPATDARDVFRIRFARALSDFAEDAGWTTLKERADQVLTAGEDVGTSTQVDYIAFNQNWMLDPGASAERIEDDAPSQTVLGWEPLYVNEIVDFYQLQNATQLNSSLETALTASRATYRIQDEPVLNIAVREALAAERPERYVIRDFEWVAPIVTVAGRRERQPRTSVNSLIKNHPLTRSFIETISQARSHPVADIVGTHNGSEGLEAVLWILPLPRDLVARFQSIPAVNELIITRLRELLTSWTNAQEPAVSGELRARVEDDPNFVDPATQVRTPVTLETLTADQLESLEWDTWWDLLQLIIFRTRDAQGRSSVLTSIRAIMDREAFGTTLRNEREAAERLRETNIRRAVAHERRRLIETQLRPALDSYVPHGPSASDRYRFPGSRETTVKRLLAEDVLRRLQLFALNLNDSDDQEAHLAMGMLELAPTVLSKLGDARVIDVLYAWMPEIDNTLVRVGRPGLETYLVDEEREAQDPSQHITGRAAQLRTVLTNMALVFREHSREWGMVGVRGDGTIEDPGHLHALDSSRELGRGLTFTIDGTQWEILSVEENFVFHPGAWPLRSIDNPQWGGSELKIGTGDYLREDQRGHRLLLTVLIDEGPEPTQIYSDDSRLLSELTWSSIRYTQIAQLLELAELMESFANLVMDLAELFPVVGPAVAATRLIATTLSFITGELPALMVHFVNNPRAVLDDLLTRLRGLLSPENFIEFVLFTNRSFDGLLTEPRRGRSGYESHSARGVRRLIAKLQTLARGVGRVFVRTQGAVQDKRQAVEMIVQSRPGLVRLIQVVADYYLLIASLADHLADIPDLRQRIDDFRAESGDFGPRVSGMIDSVGRIEIPSEILPLDELVGAVLEIIGHRLGGKYRIGVRVLFALLDFIGKRDDVIQGISGALRGVGVTTENIFPMWNDDIVPAIRDFLRQAQVALRDTLTNTFDAFDVDLNLTEPQTEVVQSGTEFPETQPDLEGSLTSAWPPGGLAVADAGRMLQRTVQAGGEPLMPGLRREAERSFGHDFSHVRVHSDGNAARLNRVLGAHGLATGSHVFLREGAVNTREGRRTLFHELAHVLQQTGARPLGERHPRAPRPGRRGAGLLLDPAAEAAAERVAQDALRRRSGAPVRVSEVPGGIQPSLVDRLGMKFLQQLTDVGAIEAEVEEIDQSGRGTGRRLIGRDVRTAVRNIGSGLQGFFRSPSRIQVVRGFRDNFRSKLTEIGAHLQNQHDDIAAAIEDIAIRSSFEAERARQGRPARMQLNVAEFRRRLERYIFGKTGILLDIDIPVRGLGADAVMRNPASPIQEITLQYVFLPPIHSNAALWRDVLTHRTTSTGTAAAIPEAERAELRPRIRAVLRSMGPSSGVWASGAYRLSHAVFAAVEELQRLEQAAGTGGRLAADALPAKDEYRNTSGLGPSSAPGNVRLHLGHYSQRSNNGPQWARERESHHITQYLLVEYFHSGQGTTFETSPDRMAFPLLRQHHDAYPGLTTTADGHPDWFAGAQRVEIARLENERGALMPTILLSRVTHRRGRLHITPSAEDFRDDTTVTNQGTAVNHIYKRALPDEQRRIEADVAADPTHYAQWENYVRRTGRSEIQDRIGAAMQGTYRYMREYMQGQLLAALRAEELDYYNDLWITGNPSSTSGMITRGEMSRVHQAAVEHNRAGGNGTSGLQSSGWIG